MSDKQPSEYLKAIVSAIVVVALPAWAYVLAYFYEFGYLSHFGIPQELMQIRYITIVTAVLSVILSILIVLYYSFNTFHKTITASREGKPFLLKRLILIWLFFILIFCMLPMITLQNTYWRLFIGCMAIIFTGELIWDVYRQPGITLNEKLNSLYTTKQNNDPFFDWVEKMLGIKILLGISLVLFTFYASFMTGSLWGTSRKNFPTIQRGTQTFVIVRAYEDSAIALPWKPDSKELRNEIFQIEKDGLSATGITMRNIGPLHTIEE